MLSKELFQAYSKQKIQKEQDARMAREKEKEERTRKVEALNRLTEGYWGIKKALHIIMAYKSAKSYNEQMYHIIDYRLDLQQLNNEVLGDVYGFAHKQEISEELNMFDKKINLLVDEWTDNNLELSWQQIKDKDKPPKKKKVPELIASLPKLKCIWDDINIVHDPFKRAAKLIREEVLKNIRKESSNTIE
jgi:hypothetical protein